MVDPESEKSLLCSRALTAESVARLSGVRLVAAGRSRGNLLLRQVAGQVAFASGLSLQYARELQVERMKTIASARPGISVKLFLEGAVHARIAETPLDMPTRAADGRWRPVAVITANRRVLPFYREAERGVTFTKLLIDIPFDWAERHLPQAVNARLNRKALPADEAVVLPWAPSARTQLLAQSIFDLADAGHGGELNALYLESVVLGLICDAFSSCQIARQAPAVPREDAARFRALVSLVDAHVGGPLPLEMLAARLGISVWTLQRLVQRVRGQTLSAYIRDHRLARARDAIVMGRASLSQIAWDAGYSSAANFTTAFRRRYGMVPSVLRASDGAT